MALCGCVRELRAQRYHKAVTSSPGPPQEAGVARCGAAYRRLGTCRCAELRRPCGTQRHHLDLRAVSAGHRDSACADGEAVGPQGELSGVGPPPECAEHPLAAGGSVRGGKASGLWRHQEAGLLSCGASERPSCRAVALPRSRFEHAGPQVVASALLPRWPRGNAPRWRRRPPATPRTAAGASTRPAAAATAARLGTRLGRRGCWRRGHCRRRRRHRLLRLRRCLRAP